MGSVTLDGLLRESAKRFPNRSAVEEPTGRSLTYAQLETASDLVCDQLVKHGVIAGDRSCPCSA